MKHLSVIEPTCDANASQVTVVNGRAPRNVLSIDTLMFGRREEAPLMRGWRSWRALVRHRVDWCAGVPEMLPGMWRAY